MSYFSRIVNAARSVTGRGASPSAPSPARQARTASVSTIPTRTSMREDCVKPTADDVAELLAYSKQPSTAQRYVHPQPEWDKDEWTIEYCSKRYLGDPGGGKAFFVNGIWGLPNPRMTKPGLELLIKEAMNDGQGPLFTKEMAAETCEIMALRIRAENAGIANSVNTAACFVSASRESIADKIRLGENVSSPILVDVEGRQRHAQEIMAACRTIQMQGSERWADIVYGPCLRLRDAARRLAESQAELEERHAQELENGFSAGNKLLGLIHFGMCDRIGAAGWTQPWWNIKELGCSLAPDADPWGCGVILFNPPAEYLQQQQASRIAAAWAGRSLATSANKQRFFQGVIKPGEIEKAATVAGQHPAPTFTEADKKRFNAIHGIPDGR